ncbi:LysR family transcriptional regulator [Streptomyces sp. NPDC001507]|uniref:LysR family transcriptional regulator n=1 Tax=Streptomyces sp. NPDC001507 TaxID=3364579 RepID=UPI0036A6AF07
MQMDLNLLTVLDALLEEGSVTGAADRLRLSAPAVSRSLGRIRRLTGDQILVRTGRTMTATPYALAVRADLHRLVQEAQGLLAPQRRLDLATLDRTFTLQFHDAVTTAIGPGLLKAVREQAPGVRLRFLAEAGTDTNDLRHGQVDIEVGATEPAAPEIRSQTLGEDRLMVAVPGDLPGERLTLARYAAADETRLTGIAADVLDAARLAEALRGSTTVLSGLGISGGSGRGVLTAGARAAVDAGARVIWLGAFGTGVTAQAAGGFTRNLLRTFMKSEMSDRVTACEVVIGAGGTVFHAGPLADTPLSAGRRTLTVEEAPRRFFPARVGRATVAAAMLDEAESGSHPGRTVIPVD